MMNTHQHRLLVQLRERNTRINEIQFSGHTHQYIREPKPIVLPIMLNCRTDKHDIFLMNNVNYISKNNDNMEIINYCITNLFNKMSIEYNDGVIKFGKHTLSNCHIGVRGQEVSDFGGKRYPWYNRTMHVTIILYKCNWVIDA